LADGVLLGMDAYFILFGPCKVFEAFPGIGAMFVSGRHAIVAMRKNASVNGNHSPYAAPQTRGAFGDYVNYFHVDFIKRRSFSHADIVA
jgi:hypothetical protein